MMKLSHLTRLLEYLQWPLTCLWQHIKGVFQQVQAGWTIGCTSVSDRSRRMNKSISKAAEEHKGFELGQHVHHLMLVK